MADLTSMAANLVPGGQAGLAALEQAKKFGGEAMKSPLGRKSLAYMGKPIFYDINKDYQPKGDKKEKSIFESAKHFVMRYVLTWGNALGLGGLLANIGIRVASARNPETPKPLLSFAGMLAPIVMLGGVAASAWANFLSTTTADELVGMDKRLAAAGLNIIDAVGQPIDKEEAAKILEKSKPENSPLRYNKDNRDEINLRANHPHKPAKIFLTGIGGTGKTQGMDLIAGRIIDFEANKPIDETNGEKRKEVVVLRLKGKDINEHILGLSSNDDLISGLIAMAGVNSAKRSAPELLLSVLNGLQDKFNKAKENNQRLIVQLDEVNELWNLAKTADGSYDPIYAEKIANAMKKLLEGNNDILMASNLSVADILGGNKEQLKASYLAGVFRQLTEASVTINAPNEDTRANVLAVYLKKQPDAAMKLFESKLGVAIKEKSEKDLTTFLKEEIEKKYDGADQDAHLLFDEKSLTDLRDLNLNKTRFEQSTGSTVEKAVEAVVAHASTSSEKITVDSLIESITSLTYELSLEEKKPILDIVDPLLHAIKQRKRDEKVSDRDGTQFELTNKKLLDTLVAADVPPEMLIEISQLPQYKELFEGIGRFNTSLCEEIKLKILKARRQ